MDDFEKVSYDELIDVIDDIYNDNRWSFMCSGSKTFKYKNQFVKITVAKDEEDL